MCPLTEGTTSSGAAGRSLSAVIWEKLLGEAGAAVKNIVFVGFGEPMLNPRFGKMLVDADRRGIATGFSTNGATLPNGFVDLASQLEHLTHINVSIETADPAVYRGVRGGKVEKALASLATLNAAFGEKAAVTASAVVMRSTVASLPELPAALAAINVQNLTLQYLHDQSPTGLGEDIGTVEGAAELIDQTVAAAAQNGVSVHFENEAVLKKELDKGGTPVPVRRPRSGESRQCNIAWQMPHIDSLGGVYPCCRASAVSRSKLGDLNDNSLAEIWNGDAFRDFRSSMLNRQGRPCPSVCSTCDAIPVGRPSISRVAAFIMDEGSGIRGRSVRLRVLNIGRDAWVGERMPVIGTSRGKDRLSAVRTSDWLTPNRIARPVEDEVAPGAYAHFTFKVVEPDPLAADEWFQLVIDGEAWLTAASFSISVVRPTQRRLRKTAPKLCLTLERAQPVAYPTSGPRPGSRSGSGCDADVAVGPVADTQQEAPIILPG